ncbi:MAG: VCBS repeat-containing protein [Nitrospinae bacterium]|nr:VCBS repeat-containing protein [Nitrospinota bacterium]MZH47233.1 VCBS repeat-containing protein [Nitrospinota bacterium]
MNRYCSVIAFLMVFILMGCPPPPKAGKKMPRIFALSYTMGTGKEPSYLITDDFNRDNIPDLVVANSGDHSFSFYKGLGDGTFKDQLVFQTGRDPICLVSGDFNEDGYKDVIALNYADQTIQVYLNTRLGSFQKTSQLLKPGKIPINMATGDFNSDGKLDLIVTLRFSNVAVLLGNGNGFFSEPYSMNVKGQPTAVVIGDYNKDKKTDVAIALAGNGRTGVQVLWGKGDGQFKPSKVFKGGKQPLSLASLDVNNDGMIEFVTSSNSLHALTTLVNNGDETFSSLRDFASGNFPKFVVAADFTGDGFEDIAVSNSTDDQITVSLGRGDGTFTYPPIYHHVDEYPQGMAVADFNGDGLLDIAVSCRDKNLIDILSKKNMINPKPDLPQPKEPGTS